jgi:hypothetical protein
MIYSNCDPALNLIGPLFLIVGSFVAYVGLLIWVNPNSNIVRALVINRYPKEEEAGPILRDLGFTREGLGPINMLVLRLIWPPVGTLFALVGLWVTISQIHCREPFPDLRALWGPLTWQHVSFFFVVFVGLIGLWNARQMRPIFREGYLFFTLLFGVAASEAAAFHVGVQANRWGAIAVICFLFSGVCWFVSTKFRTKLEARTP